MRNKKRNNIGKAMMPYCVLQKNSDIIALNQSN